MDGEEMAADLADVSDCHDQKTFIAMCR